MNIHDKLIKIFDKNGIIIFDEDADISNEIDSLQFICLLVDVEKEFNIEMPYEHLTQMIMISFNDFKKVIEQSI